MWKYEKITIATLITVTFTPTYLHMIFFYLVSINTVRHLNLPRLSTRLHSRIYIWACLGEDKKQLSR